MIPGPPSPQTEVERQVAETKLGAELVEEAVEPPITPPPRNDPPAVTEPTPQREVVERDTVVGSCSGGAGPEDAVPTGATVAAPPPDTVGGVAAGGSPDLGRRPEAPDARSMVAEDLTSIHAADSTTIPKGVVEEAGGTRR